MNIRIELEEEATKKILKAYIAKQLGNIEIEEGNIHFYVKSKQNYKSEWEDASFKLTYVHSIET